MNHKTCLIVFIVFTVCILPFFLSVSAADDATVNVYMLAEETRIRFGSPVLVADVWHNIDITLENLEFQELSLKFYKGDSMPTAGERNATNYYGWKYDKNSETPWKDIMEYDGREYINNERCLISNNNYIFCVGIKDTFPSVPYYHENWTLEIYKDEDSVYSENVVAEKPTVALAKTHGDILQLNVDPFTEMDASGDDFFIVENKGNIPLHLTIDYGTYNDIIEATGSDTTISPYSTSAHKVTLHSESWQPGILEIPGGISGSVPSSFVITTAIITFETSVEINAPDLRIFVGHSSYRIRERILGTGISFQHIEELEMSEGEIEDITAYVSGNGILTLDLRVENLRILKVSSENTEVDTPIAITSTNTSEKAITIRVEALRENNVAYIYYDLEIEGQIMTYETKINVGPPSSQPGGTISDTMPIMAIIVILCIIVVIGYMISAHMKHKRR